MFFLPPTVLILKCILQQMDLQQLQKSFTQQLLSRIYRVFQIKRKFYLEAERILKQRFSFCHITKSSMQDYIYLYSIYGSSCNFTWELLFLVYILMSALFLCNRNDLLKIISPLTRQAITPLFNYVFHCLSHSVYLPTIKNWVQS